MKPRSPFFYVGDKYKLMPQIARLFPKNIQRYYEPFVGGGSSALYIKAREYHLNDIDEYMSPLRKVVIVKVTDKVGTGQARTLHYLLSLPFIYL